MKTFMFILASLVCFTSAAQSPAGQNLLQLSAQIFKWEVNNNMDSLGNIMAENFTVVSSSGAVQTKSEYLARLTSGSFFHNRIDIEQNNAAITNNTGIVTGKGFFVVTNAGKQSTLHLSYMEVFTRFRKKDKWKLLAIYANRLPE